VVGTFHTWDITKNSVSSIRSAAIVPFAALIFVRAKTNLRNKRAHNKVSDACTASRRYSICMGRSCSLVHYADSMQIKGGPTHRK